MAVLLASGGCDSTTLMYDISANPERYTEITRPERDLLLYHYGNAAHDFVRRITQIHMTICENLFGVRWNLYEYEGSPVATPEGQKAPWRTSGAAIENGRDPVTDDYIEGRNTLFIVHALTHAKAKDNAAVYTGFLHGDGRDEATDRTAEYLDSIDELVVAGMFKGGDEVFQPILRRPWLEAGMTKVDVLLLGTKLGLDYGLTSSDLYFPPNVKSDAYQYRNRCLAAADLLASGFMNDWSEVEAMLKTPNPAIDEKHTTDMDRIMSFEIPQHVKDRCHARR